MTVRQILDGKGRDVVTMSPSATLEAAAQLLAQKKIGALILTDGEGSVAGILSERDIVRMIGTMGHGSLSQPVSEVMTMDVVTCTEDTTVDQAMEMMTRGRFRHIPVCRDRQLVGLVSIGDVVKRRIEDAEQEATQMRQYIAAG